MHGLALHPLCVIMGVEFVYLIDTLRDPSGLTIM